MWFIFDFKGMLAILVTYALIATASVLVFSVAIFPMDRDNILSAPITTSILCCLLAMVIWAHLKTTLTNPGALPMDHMENHDILIEQFGR
jgi:hypothetical protein